MLSNCFHEFHENACIYNIFNIKTRNDVKHQIHVHLIQIHNTLKMDVWKTEFNPKACTHSIYHVKHLLITCSFKYNIKNDMESACTYPTHFLYKGVITMYFLSQLFERIQTQTFTVLLSHVIKVGASVL